MHLGFKSARGGLILLTDADVVFAPDALKRAVSAQQILAADHLAVLPYVEGRGFWEPSLVAFLAAFALLRSAWLTERRGAVVWRNTAYSLNT